MPDQCPECGGAPGERIRASRMPAAICVAIALAGMIVGAVVDVRTSSDLSRDSTYYEPIGPARTMGAARLLVESEDLGSVVDQFERMLQRSRRFTGKEMADDAALSMVHVDTVRFPDQTGVWCGEPVWLVRQVTYHDVAWQPVYKSIDQFYIHRSDLGLTANWDVVRWVSREQRTRSTTMVLDAMALPLVLWVLLCRGIILVCSRLAAHRQRSGGRAESVVWWRRIGLAIVTGGVLVVVAVPHRWEATFMFPPHTPSRTSTLTREAFDAHVKAGTAGQAIREAVLTLTEGIERDQPVGFAFASRRTVEEENTAVGWPTAWMTIRHADWWVEPLVDDDLDRHIDPAATPYEIPARSMRLRFFQGNLLVYLPVPEGGSSSRSWHIGLTGLSLSVVLLMLAWWSALGVTWCARRLTERARSRQARCRRCGYDLTGYPSVP